MAYEGSLSDRIVDAAFRVHEVLGPGFLESVYEGALAVELEGRGLRVERQSVVPVLYEGTEVGVHRLDLVVEDEVVVELKTVGKVRDRQFAVVRSYLRASGRPRGVILNFAHETLEVRRVGPAVPEPRAADLPFAPPASPARTSPARAPLVEDSVPPGDERAPRVPPCESGGPLPCTTSPTAPSGSARRVSAAGGARRR